MKPPGVRAQSGEDLVVAGLDVGHLLRRRSRRCAAGRTSSGRRWNTVSSPTLSAISPITCTPVAPVPITADPLAGQLDRLVRPVVGVERLALGTRRCPRSAASSAPTAGRWPVMRKRHVSSRPSSRCRRHGVASSSKTRRLDRAAELHVLAEVELVGDVVQVAEVLGLAREALLPVPLLQQLLGEGVAVGDALGVEAGARVAVPEPRAAEVVAGLEHRGVTPSSTSRYSW